MNYYAQAIQVLADDKTDFKALAYEIAKANPKSLVTAADRLNGAGWQRECTLLVHAGKKIDAIRLCRNKTGMALKDAKDAVEALVQP